MLNVAADAPSFDIRRAANILLGHIEDSHPFAAIGHRPPLLLRHSASE